MKEINVAEAYDWHHRAYIAEHELSIERTKLEREKRKSRRLQTQINEYIEALSCSTQRHSQTRNQCQFLSISNSVLSQEVAKLRLVVQTLEGVIHLLYTFDGSGSTGTSLNGS
jgi:superoxide dismutase